MAKVLIIGAGGVGSVVAHKLAKVPQVFADILLASRTKSKCDLVAKGVGADKIKNGSGGMPMTSDNWLNYLRALDHKSSSMSLSLIRT